MLDFQHLNIAFTFEKEEDDQLVLLDLLVSKKDKSFCSSVYHQIIFIGLYISFSSFTQYFYKIRLIKTLIIVLIGVVFLAP